MSAPEQPDRRPASVQEELAIPDPSPIPKQISTPDAVGTVNAQFNYNVNLPAVQLPAWEEFSKYPPEVREFWMRAGEKEQNARHAWIDKEQQHRHHYDEMRLSSTFESLRTGQILGACLSCFCIAAGAAIVIAGGSPWGYAAILAGITPLVGMAIYAKNATMPKPERDHSEDSGQHGNKPLK